MLRQKVRQYYLRRLLQLPPPAGRPDGPAGALVVAPHPDDETLGCGGTILQKTAAGDPVTIVFLTDGRTSHAHLLPVAELVAARRREAVAAAAALGVPETNVHFFDFPDGRLAEFAAPASKKIAALLRNSQPGELYVPHHADPQLDHQAANQIVWAALRQTACRAAVFEYPVWLWYAWPWVSPPLRSRREFKLVAQNSITTRLGRQMTQDFNTAVNCRSVLTQKKTALQRHQTQMSQYRSIPGWQTLHDVAGGEWLAYFFTGVEIFQRFA